MHCTTDIRAFNESLWEWRLENPLRCDQFLAAQTEFQNIPAMRAEDV
jgi:hypothetical protein